MDEVQVEIKEAIVDSEDLILLNDYIDLLLDPTLPIEQFYINSCIPALPVRRLPSAPRTPCRLLFASGA